MKEKILSAVQRSGSVGIKPSLCVHPVREIRYLARGGLVFISAVSGLGPLASERESETVLLKFFKKKKSIPYRCGVLTNCLCLKGCWGQHLCGITFCCLVGFVYCFFLYCEIFENDILSLFFYLYFFILKLFCIALLGK